ncbi:MAG: signal peptidase I [Candidatus Riflebacteria bacterium]|nr:signal peptidase I [Candidatus Riflebacteria bacterium]
MTDERSEGPPVSNDAARLGRDARDAIQPPAAAAFGRVWPTLLIYLVLPALLAVFLLRFVAAVTWMVSGSMAPALRADSGAVDGVFIDKLTPRLREPGRGEIVYFRSPTGEWVCKRVVGLPNEEVELKDGLVVVNGRAVVDHPALARIKYVNGGHLEPGTRVRIRPGNLLVLGDDSSDSWDSRYFGCVPAGEIAGLARAVIWPPSRIGWL